MAPILIATILRPHGPTGVQTHFDTFARYLQARQDAAPLVTPYDISPAFVYPAFALRKVVAPVSRAAEVLWYRAGHALFLRWALRKRLASQGPCVIYAQCPVSAEAALRARRSPAQKVVLVVHFNISQADEWAGQGLIASGGRVWQHIRDCEARLLPQLDGIVFVSRFMREVLIERVPALARVAHAIIPNFVDDPKPAEALPIDTDLVSIGTLESRKNQAYLLHLVAAARRLGATLTLTLIGDGPDRADLSRQAHELGIADQVRFAGLLSDASNRLPRHRAYVHAARMENLPITLIEALSHGRMVFAPAVGGIPEIVEDGVEGRLIPLDDVEAAARIVTTTLRDTALVDRCGKAARQKFERCFRLCANAERLHEFLARAGAVDSVSADSSSCALA